jgi:hypothetical protein
MAEGRGRRGEESRGRSLAFLAVVGRIALTFALLALAVRAAPRVISVHAMELARGGHHERVEAVARTNQDRGRLPAIRGARSGEPPGAGRARDLPFGASVVADSGVTPGGSSRSLDARTIAQRTWRRSAPTRAELMVFLN